MNCSHPSTRITSRDAQLPALSPSSPSPPSLPPPSVRFPTQERLSYKKLLEAFQERAKTNERYGDVTFRSAVMGRPIGQLEIGPGTALLLAERYYDAMPHMMPHMMHSYPQGHHPYACSIF